MPNRTRIEGERVFCHECENEWSRAQGGLECPRCHSEFTEILSNPPSPPAHPRSPISPLHDHNPWAQPNFPDPDESDINTVHFNTRLGNSTISFTSRTFHSGDTGGLFRSRSGDPAADQVSQDFASMLHGMMGRRGQDRSRSPEPFPPLGGMGFVGQPAGARQGGRTDGQPDFFQSPLAPMFGAIFSTLGNMQQPGQTRTADGQEMPPHPFMLLQHLFNPAGQAHGDAVFSQEALDRVISQLMEQNAAGNAPPPASEEAIKSLPTKPVEKSMLGNDGKAECSICMDNVEIGEEVTFLPCKHWFHGPCVTAWLKEHDTCPHCRASISAPPPEQQQSGPQQRPSQSRRSSRATRMFHSNSPLPSTSRQMPGAMPDDVAPDRQPQGGFPYDSASPDHRRRESQRRSSNSGSGVGGWIRRQLGN